MMGSLHYKNIIWPLLVSVAIAIGSLSGAVDSDAEEALETALKRSLVTFGIARSLNAVISAAQGTEVSVSPLGMGVTLAPGEVLDPVNDLVERFSGFMLVSSVALGTQRVLLEVSSWLPYSLFLVALSCAWVISRFVVNPSINYWSHWLGRALLIFTIIRFVVPAAVIGSEWMYSGFLQSRHIAAEDSISMASNNVQAINQERGIGANQGLENGSWNKLKNWANGAKNNAASLVQLDNYSQALKETAKDTIELIVVFLMSTFLLPVAIALALWQLTKWALSIPPTGRRGMGQ